MHCTVHQHQQIYLLSYWPKVANFNLLCLHLSPPRCCSNFAQISATRKVESLVYYVALFSVILCLAVLIQYQRMTERQTYDDGIA